MNVPLPTWILRLAVLLTVTACNGKTPVADTGPTEGRKLVVVSPPGPDVGLRPGTDRMLQVQYLDSDTRELPGEPVRFAIFGDPHGSTLTTDIAVTDPDGVARIRIHAGAVTSRFEVRASAEGASDAVFYVEVSAAGFGALTVSGTYQGALGADQVSQLTRVVYTLYGSIGCGSVNHFNPPPGLRTRTASKVTEDVLFESLPLDVNHTIAARALHPLGTGQSPTWQLRAAGCVELPVGSLAPCTPSTDGGGCPEQDRQAVTLLLADVWPRVTGAYSLTSRLTLPTSNRPLADALKPWSDLSDCPLDPEQLVLDCLLDALDDDDPLDCLVEKPSPKTLALVAERGQLEGKCRNATTDRGTTSLEKKLRQLAGASGLNAALKSVEASAAERLRELELASTLELQFLAEDGPIAGTLVMSHQLDSLTFVSLATGTSATFNVPSLGLVKWLANPVKGAVAPDAASAWDWQITLEQHSFSLRYGLLAREALGKLVLAPSGLPADSAGLAAKLVESFQAGGDKGCAAIEPLACKAARLPPGCLGPACLKGIKALAAFLDSGFAAIDTTTSELALEGAAKLRDNDGDLRADGLGTSGAPGSWKARLFLGNEVVVPQQATFISKP